MAPTAPGAAKSAPRRREYTGLGDERHGPSVCSSFPFFLLLTPAQCPTVTPVVQPSVLSLVSIMELLSKVSAPGWVMKNWAMPCSGLSFVPAPVSPLCGFSPCFTQSRLPSSPWPHLPCKAPILLCIDFNPLFVQGTASAWPLLSMLLLTGLQFHGRLKGMVSHCPSAPQGAEEDNRGLVLRPEGQPLC